MKALANRLIHGIFSIILIFSCAKGLSFGVITEFHLAKQYLKKYPVKSPKEEYAFLLGVWLPGAWYVSKTQKQPIPYDCIEINKIKTECDQIKKGILFHKYIHHFEENHYKENGLILKANENNPELLKIATNIFGDMIFYKERYYVEGKKLLNDILYTEFNIDKLTDLFTENDLTVWFFTIFVYLQTSVIDTGSYLTSADKYKGIHYNLSLSEDMRDFLKNELPKFSGDKNIKLAIQALVSQCIQSF